MKNNDKKGGQLASLLNFDSSAKKSAVQRSTVTTKPRAETAEKFNILMKILGTNASAFLEQVMEKAVEANAAEIAAAQKAMRQASAMTDLDWVRVIAQQQQKNG